MTVVVMKKNRSMNMMSGSDDVEIAGTDLSPFFFITAIISFLLSYHAVLLPIYGEE